MKLLLSTLAVVSLYAMLPPASFAVDTSISPLCRDGAPAAYARPGGFCEQVASNASLIGTKSPRCGPGYVWSNEEGCVSE